MMKSGPCLPQLEEALAQKRRPNTVRKKERERERERKKERKEERKKPKVKKKPKKKNLELNHFQPPHCPPAPSDLM